MFEPNCFNLFLKSLSVWLEHHSEFPETSIPGVDLVHYGLDWVDLDFGMDYPHHLIALSDLILNRKKLLFQLQIRKLSFPLQIYNILFEQEKIQYAEEMDKFRREKQEAVAKEMHEQVSLLKQVQEQDRTLQHSAPQQDHHQMPGNSQSNFPPEIHFRP